MRLLPIISPTAWGRLVLLLALAMSTTMAAIARPKPVPHHGRIYIPKMLPTVLPEAREGYQTVLRGRVSWYGKFFQGMETASGELYDRFEYTCAHKKLPFNTRLRVTNLKNGLTVVVRVTDRGPYRRERIVDLSEKAASTIDLLDDGQASVIAVVVPEATPLGPTKTPTDLSALQAGDPRPKAPFTAYLLPLPSPEAGSAAETPAIASLLKQPAGPLASLAGAASAIPGASFGVDTSLLANLAQRTAKPASGVEQLILHGQPANPMIISQLDSWLAAETVRRSLQGGGALGLVRPTQPDPEPDAGDSLMVTID